MVLNKISEFIEVLLGNDWLTESITKCSFFLAAVNFICDHPTIKAISFVGSNQAGEYIYERGSKNGKRVQSNMVRTHSNWCVDIGS